MAIRLLLLIGVALASSGCATMQDISYRKSHRCRAYVNSIVTFNAPILNKHYTHGYREGYYDLSTGKRCKPPILPPHEYWKSCYQDCRGQEKIAEWYRGYEQGMIAAEKATGSHFHQIRPHGLCPPSAVGMATYDGPIGPEGVPAAPSETIPSPQTQPGAGLDTIFPVP
jgi:hypothetical protein